MHTLSTSDVMSHIYAILKPRALLLLLLIQILTAWRIEAQQNLPEKLLTAIDKTLDDQFSEIEKELSRLGDIDQKDILLITVPLENYIEDVLFRINRPAIIYPRIIFSIIRKLLKEGKSRATVEQLLVEMQKHREFDKLYEAAKQKL